MYAIRSYYVFEQHGHNLLLMGQPRNHAGKNVGNMTEEQGAHATAIEIGVAVTQRQKADGFAVAQGNDRNNFV